MASTTPRFRASRASVKVAQFSESVLSALHTGLPGTTRYGGLSSFSGCPWRGRGRVPIQQRRRFSSSGTFSAFRLNISRCCTERFRLEWFCICYPLELKDQVGCGAFAVPVRLTPERLFLVSYVAGASCPPLGSRLSKSRTAAIN